MSLREVFDLDWHDPNERDMYIYMCQSSNVFVRRMKMCNGKDRRVRVTRVSNAFGRLICGASSGTMYFRPHPQLRETFKWWKEVICRVL